MSLAWHPIHCDSWHCPLAGRDVSKSPTFREGRKFEGRMSSKSTMGPLKELRGIWLKHCEWALANGALLEIRVERFDPLPDGSLLLECTWKLQPIGGGDAAPRAFRTTVPIPRGVGEAGGNMAGRILAMNGALEQLARKVRGSL